MHTPWCCILGRANDVVLEVRWWVCLQLCVSGEPGSGPGMEFGRRTWANLGEPGRTKSWSGMAEGRIPWDSPQPTADSVVGEPVQLHICLVRRGGMNATRLSIDVKCFLRCALKRSERSMERDVAGRWVAESKGSQHAAR